MKPALLSLQIVFLLTTFALGEASAKPPEPPPYNQLRYEENYEYLKNPELKTGPLDSIKYIPLGKNGKTWLTLGGETRQHFEFIDNNNWGAGTQDDDGYWLQRYMLHGDLHLGENLRAFAQFKSNFEAGRRGGPRAVDQDDFDLHQAFVDYRMRIGPNASLTLRPGRQEIIFGSRRFINYRERPNVRFSQDGLRLNLKTTRWDVSAVAARPVEVDPGVFDDDGEDRQAFWSLYSVRKDLPMPFPANGDFYYMGIERERAVFDQGVADEFRHAIGTRLWGKARGWDYNFEFIYQFGTFGAADIKAWTAASNTGYTIPIKTCSIRLSLRAEAMSGDDDPTDSELNTFNPFFPRGKHISQLAASGLMNQIYLKPQLDFKFGKPWSLTVGNLFLWRQSADDGLYSIGNGLLRTGASSDKLYVGHQPEVELKWQVNRHLAWKATFNYFFAGPFLRETPPSGDITYLGSMATFVF